MTYQTPSPNRLPLPSAIPAAQWRRQEQLDEAAAYRLASQATGPRTCRSLAPLAAGLGAALIRAGQWLRAYGVSATREPAGS